MTGAIQLGLKSNSVTKGCSLKQTYYEISLIEYLGTYFCVNIPKSAYLRV